MKRRFRIRRQAEFRSAVSGRRIYSGRSLIAFAIPSERAETRVGVTVSRNLKSSVQRNRARRRLRELARLSLLGPGSPLREVGIRYDVVLIARPPAVDAPFSELKAETEQAAIRLANQKP